MPEPRVEVQFWTCLNYDHKSVTWSGDVACCDRCGLTSEMTGEWLQSAREVDRAEVERLRVELAETREKLSDAVTTAEAHFTTYLETVAQRDALKAAARHLTANWMRRAENITGANEGETFPNLTAIRDARAGVLRSCTRDVLAALSVPESTEKAKSFSELSIEAMVRKSHAKAAGGTPKHIGGRANAEDCPGCAGLNLPYPWICPGEPVDEYVTCSECDRKPIGNYPVAHEPSCSRMTIAPHLWPAPETTPDAPTGGED